MTEETHEGDPGVGPEEDFETLLEQGMGDPAVFDPGDVMEAVITQITNDWTFIDFGGKADGYIATAEFFNPDGEITVKQGETIQAFFLPSPHHKMRFTTRLTAETAEPDRLEEVYRSNIPLEGVVEKEIKGGFAIRITGSTRAFCPYSQMAIHRISDAGRFIGKNLTFRIIQYEKGGRNIVVSRRAILEAEREEAKNALRKTLKEGMTVRGTITAIAAFGAFVDVGGLEGLIPVSHVSWGRVEDIRAVLQIGQAVDVIAKRLDWENDKFSFSVKEAQADPWQDVSAKYPEGSTHTGTVARMAPFGAFVTLEPGVDGLLHISELKKENQIHHPREVIEENQAIEIKIGRVDVKQRRLSLELPTEGTQETEYQEFLAAKPSSTGLGTLGDLLRAKMDEKKGG